MTIINTTPHTVTLISSADRSTIVEQWTPSELQARVSSTEAQAEHPTGLPCVRHSWSSADDQLPEPAAGVYYIVSTLFADRLVSRSKTDLLIPDSGPSAVRENGQIKGVIRFTLP